MLNLIFCEKKERLALIMPYINLNRFIVVMTSLDIEILLKNKNNKINYIIFDDKLNVNIEVLKKICKRSFSFSQFVSMIKNGIEKEKEEKIQQSTFLNEINKIEKEKKEKSVIKREIAIEYDFKYKEEQEEIDLDDYDLNKEIYIFTSVKGGVGVSSTIKNIAGKIKEKTLILDLSFIDGGSDLSYYFNLPQTPNISSYINDIDDKKIEEHVIKVNKNVDILQAPPSKNVYEQIGISNILEIIDKANYKKIIIDLPVQSQFNNNIFYDICKYIYVLTEGTEVELNRIQTILKNYENKTYCIVNKNIDYIIKLGYKYFNKKKLNI